MTRSPRRTTMRLAMASIATRAVLFFLLMVAAPTVYIGDNDRSQKRLSGHEHRSRSSYARVAGWVSIPRLRHKNTARRMIEQRLSHRSPPPARAERGLLLVADHDEVAFQLSRKAADFFHRLADREVPGDGEALLLELGDAFVQHFLSALLFLFEQLLGQKTLGQEHARGHAGHREKVGFRMGERRDLGTGE